MSVKRKRVVVPLETKFEAIKRVDNGETIKKVAKELGVGEVTVGDWMRNRRNIEEWCSQRVTDSNQMRRKTMKKGEFERTSEALFQWFTEMRQQGVTLSGPIIQAKALELQKLFGDGDDIFTASVGWLDRWKKRYGISLFNVSADAHKRSVSQTDGLLVGPKDTEATSFSNGFFWNNTSSSPDFSLVKTEIQEYDSSEYQDNDHALPELIYSNNLEYQRESNGLDDKSYSEEFLREKQARNLSFNNANQLHSWMDSCFFEKYFKDVISRSRRNKEINGTQSSLPNGIQSYCQETGPELHYSSSDSGSLQDIVRPLNRNYRKLILKQILEDLENNGSVFSSLEKINEQGMVYWLKESWKEIQNFNSVNLEKNMKNEDKIFQDLIRNPPVPFPVTAEDVQDWMNDVAEAETNSKDFNSVNDEVCNIKQETEGNGEPTEETKISHKEGFHALETALHYAEQQADCTPEELHLLRKLKNRAGVKQTIHSNQEAFTES